MILSLFSFIALNSLECAVKELLTHCKRTRMRPFYGIIWHHVLASISS